MVYVMGALYQHHTACNAFPRLPACKHNASAAKFFDQLHLTFILHICSKVKVGKVYVSLDTIIGQHYGVQFEIGQNGRDISIKRHNSDR